MKIAPYLFALALPVTALATTLPASAQAAPEKLFTSGADIPALIAKAKANQKSPAIISAIPILTMKPYQVLLEYRTGVTPPTIHHGQAEMIQVLKGTANLAMGGHLVGAQPRRSGTTTVVGTGITGATKRPITAGDYVMVPPDTPHQFQDIHGEFVIVSIHPIVPGK